MNTQSAGGSWLEKLYIALALVGLVGTWAQAAGYLGNGVLAGNIAFWKDTISTPAGLFIVVDLFVLAAAVFVLMFTEARRIGMAAG